MVRSLASHQCGLGSNPSMDAICGLSLLLVLSFAPRVFFRCALWFSPLLKNQHCQITIRPRIRYTRNHFVDVLPLNQYIFNIIFTVYF